MSEERRQKLRDVEVRLKFKSNIYLNRYVFFLDSSIEIYR